LKDIEKRIPLKKLFADDQWKNWRYAAIREISICSKNT